MRRVKSLCCHWVFLLLMIVVASACAAETRLEYVNSFDGEPISYSVYGNGDVALVFVHGWSCDSRYWREQAPYFSKKYKVVTVDLAGHGHSGAGREVYSLRGFAEDVKAVVEDMGLERVILIGHSMGGGVAAKATTLMPGPVIGIVGVDNLQNVESAMPDEELNAIIDAQKKDFRGAVTSFAEGMIVEGTDPSLKEWIISDMSAASPRVGISAFQEFIGTFKDYGMAKIFDEIKVPVRCINADLWPTDIEANRRHMTSFDVKIMEGLGHFVMMEKPKEFNTILDGFVEEIKQIAEAKKH
ncbi:alpha/beta fold hydrolase [Candidatus Omnitrophota bacterium]